MYTTQPKKMLIVNILDILKNYTDENHRLSQKQIIDILEKDYTVPEIIDAGIQDAPVGNIFSELESRLVPAAEDETDAAEVDELVELNKLSLVEEDAAEISQAI